MDVLLVINWLLALLVCGIEFRNIRHDRRRDHWVRAVTLGACAYACAYYTYNIMFGPTPGGMLFARQGATLLVTAMLARAVYDSYRLPGTKP